MYIVYLPRKDIHTKKERIMQEFIKMADLDFCRWDKPFQTVYIEFVRKNPGEILEFGEFEALRRWLLSRPRCIDLQGIIPQTSHKAARDFYKGLRKEQKASGF